MTDDELRFVLSHGVLAPSGDNSQPWKFRRKGETLELFVYCQHELHFFEAGYRTLYLSAGAVIENIRVAAAFLGYRLAVNYFPAPSDPLCVAAIHFQRDTIDLLDRRHSPVLQTRVTNRRFYSLTHRIDQAFFRKMERVTSAQKGFRFLWIRKGEPAYGRISRMIGAADQIRYENRKIFEEFVPLVRFTREEIEETRDGLDVRTFEIGPAGAAFFKLISSWDRLRLLNYGGVSLSMNVYARLQMLFSQACGLVVAPSTSPEDYVLGGEISQRLWHEMTLDGLALQPMESLPVFLMNLQLNGGRDFTDQQKQKVKGMMKEFLSLFGIQEKNGMIFLFRLGYAQPPKVRSLRRPLESFWVKD